MWQKRLEILKCESLSPRCEMQCPHQVREHHPEDGVEPLPGGGGEGVVGDALGVPAEVRVGLHVEDVDL